MSSKLVCGGRSRALLALVALAGRTWAVAVSGSVAGATTVTTETQLRAAFDTDSSIVLANDISLTDCAAGDLRRNTGGSPLVLDGAGHTITQTCVGHRVMYNNTADAITLENVTITGGNVNDGPGGGGIHLQKHSDLTVLNSAIVNNLTCEQGGGIELDSGGNLTVKNSTISGNTATDTDGGGIANVDDPTDKMIIINSTISNNTSVEAGGIEVDGGSLQLVYATVTDNTVNPNLACPPALEALGKPAGAGNEDKHHGAQPQATPGIPANIRVNDSTTQILTSFGSLVAFPHGGPNCDSFQPLPLANTVSQGWNYSDDDSCGFTNTASGDKQNAADPMIGALANNQPTSVTMPAPVRQARLPLTGSPLIDAIPAASCQAAGAVGITTDERSVPRPQGTSCDIGAVEIEVIAPPPPIVIAPAFTG